VAPKDAGSSPVGHPLAFSIDNRNHRGIVRKLVQRARDVCKGVLDEDHNGRHTVDADATARLRAGAVSRSDGGPPPEIKFAALPLPAHVPPMSGSFEP
jgi:hypothetical protein